MELFDSFTNILSLLFGGSLISIVTWKFARRKAAAEAKQAGAVAKQAEAEAEKAKAEAIKERQDYYQQMMDDVAKDRDYYKHERDEYRETIKGYDVRIDALERTVARNGRMVEYKVTLFGGLGSFFYGLSYNEDGTPNTAHSLNDVPFIVVNADVESVKDGKLADVAPTILKLMGIEQPAAMTGEALV